MQPYHHYLAEYQKMDPRMEKNYTVSHPDLEIHCLDEEDSQAVLCSDIHAKILLLRYFTEGDHMRATGNLIVTFPGVKCTIVSFMEGVS